MQNGVEFLQPISAQTDEQAIAAWLNQNLSPVTAINYRKDAERFLMWLRVQGRSLRDIVIEDLIAYSDYIRSLADLPAIQAEQWISGQRRHKSDSRWRPFRGALSNSSQTQALVSVVALIRWLDKMGYIKSRFAKRIVLTVNRECFQARYLPWESIDFLLDAAARMPGRSSEMMRYRARLRFLVCFCVYTGARLSDLPLTLMSSIYCNSDGLWWWSAPTIGGKVMKVPVTDKLLTELKRYRLEIGMQELPHSTESVPLIQSLRGPSAASEISLYQSLKKLFKLTSELVRDQNPDLARRLEVASPSWLRNTYLSRLADRDVNPQFIQANARHTDIKSTIRKVRLNTRVSYLRFNYE